MIFITSVMIFEQNIRYDMKSKLIIALFTNIVTDGMDKLITKGGNPGTRRK